VIEIFSALADDNRLRIIALLSEGEMCVCDIEKQLGLTQSNVSRHLNLLKNLGILSASKKAQWVYYAVSEQFKNDNHILWEYLIEKFNQPRYQMWKRVKIKDSIEVDSCLLNPINF